MFTVTERARKLRAQYALQAQSLRTRIELRINRIPTSLRKANMGDLYEQYTGKADGKQKAAAAGPRLAEPDNVPTLPEKPSTISEEVPSMPVSESRSLKRNR